MSASPKNGGAMVSTLKSLEHIEIEYKYRANWISKEEFIETCKSLKPFKTLNIYGPDTYYESPDKQIVRWRHSSDINELTIKSRTSKNSSLIRKEVDLKLGTNSLRTIITFLKSLGLVQLFRIYKDCNIFWFKDEEGTVSVVYYTVYSRNRPKRSFVEVEVEKNQVMSIDSAKALVKKWEDRLGLKPAQRINATLLEIYSDKQTKLLQE